MCKLINRLKGQSGHTLVEMVIIVSVFAVVIGAAVSLTQMAYWMNRQAQDGFEAQNEGRRVLSEMVRYLRPGENINSDDVPIIHATSDGKVIDMRIDTDKDLVPEIARLELDEDTERILLWLDFKDENGLYAYEVADAAYTATYGSGTAGDPTDTGLGGSPWDEQREIAHKIVNAAPGGTWDAQTPVTDPGDDFRLFTFYAEDFDAPIDTVNLDNWQNYVKGVKIYIWSDIQPAEIPSPFGLVTNVHLRNVQGE